MPKMYNKKGDEVLVDREQMTIMKGAGYSLENPKAKTAKKAALNIDSDSDSDNDAAEKEAEEKKARKAARKAAEKKKAEEKKAKK